MKGALPRSQSITQLSLVSFALLRRWIFFKVGWMGGWAWGEVLLFLPPRGVILEITSACPSPATH